MEKGDGVFCGVAGKANLRRRNTSTVFINPESIPETSRKLENQRGKLTKWPIDGVTVDCVF